MSVHPTAATGFSSGAAAYERGRPGYPASAVEALVRGLDIAPGRRVVDLAAGTGKLTRLLAPTGASLVAVEPVAEMRSALVASLPDVATVDAVAEAMPFPDGALDAVTVAQAFHWFDAEVALAELARVLSAGGGLGLVWNERDESVPWVAELSRVIRWSWCRPYDTDTDWVQVVEASGCFEVERLELRNHQELDAEGLVDRALSTSYIAASSPAKQAAVARDVRALAAGLGERFTLPYVTSLYLCRRR